MVPEAQMDAQTDARTEVRPPIEQEPPPSEAPLSAPPPPPADTLDVREVEREAPPPAAPPTPPRGGLAASIQQMPSGWRWALGLACAFLSSLVPLLLTSIAFGDTSGNNIDIASPAILLPMVMTSVGVIVAFMLAAAAGFVLTRWVAVLALAATAAVGAFVGSVAAVQLTPAGGIEGLTGMNAVGVVFFFFALLDLVPLILVLVAGVGLGKQQGLTLGQAHAISERELQVSRWIAAFASVIAAGLLTNQLGNMPGMLAMQIPAGAAAVSALPGVLYAIVLAATCLLAGCCAHGRALWRLQSCTRFLRCLRQWAWALAERPGKMA